MDHINEYAQGLKLRDMFDKLKDGSKFKIILSKINISIYFVNTVVNKAMAQPLQVYKIRQRSHIY
jgi:hypothetical protein